MGLLVFSKDFRIFHGKSGSNLYFVSFPFSVVVGFFIVFLFIWFSFKTIQLQCFNNSNWIWIFTYLAIILLIVGFFYVFFIPQSLLAFGPYIQVSNWVFIIFSFIVMPIGLRIERNISKNILIHFINKKLITSYANLVLLMIKSLNYSYRKHILQ